MIYGNATEAQEVIDGNDGGIKVALNGIDSASLAQVVTVQDAGLKIEIEADQPLVGDSDVFTTQVALSDILGGDMASNIASAVKTEIAAAGKLVKSFKITVNEHQEQLSEFSKFCVALLQKDQLREDGPQRDPDASYFVAGDKFVIPGGKALSMNAKSFRNTFANGTGNEDGVQGLPATMPLFKAGMTVHAVLEQVASGQPSANLN